MHHYTHSQYILLFSDFIVFIKVFTIELNNEDDKLSPCKTILCTLIGDIIKVSVIIEIVLSVYKNVTRVIILSGTWSILSGTTNKL